ncbi:hypothetical protein SHI21_11215 [Bacteriovorax sp. PP10]|uniref:Lipoprotein n=1 Tax=Bacteriovorax antarcticus TaxID=3088717 RepID=A0ABU5VXN0_9BACT|nr:hypothetical protein [Bacteriovorax sp. PP10]MEA9356780.1 hypothetical protein [Bacteriovorax sp. PP10]
MKFLVQHLFICAVIVLSSCTTVPNRFPAEAENTLFDAVFSIPKGNIPSEKSYKENFTNELTFQQERIEAFKLKIELIETKSLAGDAAYKIELLVDPKTGLLTYKVFHIPSAFNDPIASYHLLDFLSHIITSEQFLSPYSTFELYYNAKNGDPIALEAFYKLHDQKNHFINQEASPFFESEGYKKNKHNLQKLKVELNSQIKKFKAERATKRTERKIGLDALDKAPEGKQFRMLVAKGDRAGAAAIIKKYLPWEAMAPFEKQFWENYLAVMVNPVPLAERVLIYRGLGDDFVNRAYVGGKELSEKEAILQNKAFFMSSVMIKNQGSWNRRLRSLEAMNEKYIVEINGTSEFSQSARITSMFLNHSANPQGSPFLSFSPAMSVAEGFVGGKERVSGYLFDPRILSFNYTSAFEEEIEYLVPLTTFPDELVGILDQDLTPGEYKIYHNEEFMNKRLEKLIASVYGENKKSEVVGKIKQNTYDFFKGNYAFMKNPEIQDIGKSNLTFYKNFLTKNDPQPALSPTGELDCKNLIKFFWVAN